MSNEIVVRHERKGFYRSRRNAMIGGVCSGIASYVNVDVSIVRVAFIALAVFNTWVVLGYLALMFVIPSEDDGAAPGTWAEDLVLTIKTDVNALSGYLSSRDREGWRTYWRQIGARCQRRWNEWKSWM